MVSRPRRSFEELAPPEREPDPVALGSSFCADEVGRDVAAVELHATTSSSVSSDLASSTVMTPSLPTFFMASERNLPISASPLAEMVPTWTISSLEVTLAVPADECQRGRARHGQSR